MHALTCLRQPSPVHSWNKLARSLEIASSIVLAVDGAYLATDLVAQAFTKFSKLLRALNR